jgi:VanZ family protein
VVKVKNLFPFWRFLCVALTAMILWLALMPSASAPSGLGWDKLNHVGAIAVVTGLAYFSLSSRSWAATAAFLYGTSIGILIEILQATLTTTRTAEWGDLLADLIGAGSVWVLIRLFQIYRERL